MSIHDASRAMVSGSTIRATMPRYRRARDGQTYFFTLLSFRRRPILCTSPVRNALRSALIEIRQRRPFEIDAWVLMPDHLHCIWTLPSGDDDYSIRWALIKRLVSRSCAEQFKDDRQPSSSRIKHRDSVIWHRRFHEHKIRDEWDFEKHMDYLHFNPVKHGHAESVAAWPFSTFHRYVREGVYAADWGGAIRAVRMEDCATDVAEVQAAERIVTATGHRQRT
ncbi:MAG: transposase [Pseudomonadota bacterium]